MKKILLILVLLCIGLTSFAQDTIRKQQIFRGGEKALGRFIQKNLVYPRGAKSNKIQGTVYVKFTIEQDGSITDVKLEKGIGGGCDEETIRLIKKMPNWSAGTDRIRVTFPIEFRL